MSKKENLYREAALNIAGAVRNEYKRNYPHYEIFNSEVGFEKNLLEIERTMEKAFQDVLKRQPYWIYLRDDSE